MTPSEVLALLSRMVASDEEPTLTVDDLIYARDMNKTVDRADNLATNTTSVTVWQASKNYLAGDVIRTGQTPERFYICRVSGISGTTAPAWPVRSTDVPSGIIAEGDQLVWEDAGATWNPSYDIHAAAAELWRWKAAKASSKFSFSTDGQSFQRREIIANCLEMAAQYAKRSAGSIRVRSK